MKSGRGADVRCITLEFKGVLVLGEGICLVLKQPGVVARNGFNERVLSDPLKIQKQVIISRLLHLVNMQLHAKTFQWDK